MKLTFTNKTGYDYLLFAEEQPPVNAERNQSVTVETEDDTAKIYLRCMKKSYSHIEWLAIIFGIFFGDSTNTVLYYDYAFRVRKTEKDAVKITLDVNNWTPREQLSLRAPYAHSQEAELSDIRYTAPMFEKVRKKHLRLHTFVTSLLPVEILLSVLCFVVKEPAVIALFLFLMMIILFVFTLPAFKEIRRFKAAAEPEYVNKTLIEYAVKKRNGDTKGVNEDTSKIGKLTGKIIDKMFKFDD